MNLTDDRAEKALRYLAETDEECAELKADMERQEYKVRAMKSTVFRMTTGTVAERQAAAECHDDVTKAEKEHCDAIQRFNAMANKRATETLVIEVWRSVFSARKRGVV